MLKILILCAALLQTAIYSIHFNNNAGTDITLAPKAGKRILLVNIASGSPKVSQLAGLQQLYAQYHDSLEIVVFPSNSFGHEPLSDAAVKSLCENTYHTTFTIAAKEEVKGSHPQAIYRWLADAAENGQESALPAGDFHKFLIDKDGTFIGSFSPSILPGDSILVKAVRGIE
jgi:glutathione peroxidase